MALSDSLVLVILGQKWAAVSPILFVLGFLGIIEATRGLIGPVLLARGKPGTITNVLGINIAILVPLTLVGIAQFGAVGVAYAMLLATILTTPLLYVAIKKEIGVDEFSIWQRIWRPLLASATMAIVINTLEKRMLADSQASVSALLLLIFTGIAVYCLMAVFLWFIARRPDGSEKDVFGMLAMLLDRFRSRQ